MLQAPGNGADARADWPSWWRRSWRRRSCCWGWALALPDDKQSRCLSSGTPCSLGRHKGAGDRTRRRPGRPRPTWLSGGPEAAAGDGFGFGLQRCQDGAMAGIGTYREGQPLTHERGIDRHP